MKDEKTDDKESYTKAELEGLRQIADVLTSKDKSQRIRMLHWAADKFAGCTLRYKK